MEQRRCGTQVGSVASGWAPHISHTISPYLACLQLLAVVADEAVHVLRDTHARCTGSAVCTEGRCTAWGVHCVCVCVVCSRPLLEVPLDSPLVDDVLQPRPHPVAAVRARDPCRGGVERAGRLPRHKLRRVEFGAGATGRR